MPAPAHSDRRPGDVVVLDPNFLATRAPAAPAGQPLRRRRADLLREWARHEPEPIARAYRRRACELDFLAAVFGE